MTFNASSVYRGEQQAPTTSLTPSVSLLRSPHNPSLCLNYIFANGSACFGDAGRKYRRSKDHYRNYAKAEHNMI